MGRSHAMEIEEAIWERMHFARHLRSERLGEFTLGTELHRSESLALVQLLILYTWSPPRRASPSAPSAPAARRSAPPRNTPGRATIGAWPW